MTLRVMFDSNAYDAILKYGDAERILNLINIKSLTVITTHLQKDELLKIPPKKENRAALLDIYHRLNGKSTHTTASLWGVSKWGQANWTDESQSNSLSGIKRNRASFSEDDLIGITAKDNCDILVTHDKDLTARLKDGAPNLRVLTYDSFRSEFLA
jgi:predicted nucleic acid-binding protein